MQRIDVVVFNGSASCFRKRRRHTSINMGKEGTTKIGWDGCPYWSDVGVCPVTQTAKHLFSEKPHG